MDSKDAYRTFGAIDGLSSATGHRRRSKLHTSRIWRPISVPGTLTMDAGIFDVEGSPRPVVVLCKSFQRYRRGVAYTCKEQPYYECCDMGLRD